MRKKITLIAYTFVVLSLIASIPFLMGAAGLGFTTWPSWGEAVTSTDIIAGTNVSNTTSSDDGTASKMLVSAAQ